MDELLKNCNYRLFKVGDKVRIRRDIKDLAELKRADIYRYTRIFPNKIQTSEKSPYEISYGMVVSAGKTAEVTEIIPGPDGAPLLSTVYRLKINESYSEWCWKHALLEKVEEGNSDDSAEVDGAKWELPLKVGQKVLIRKNLKQGDFGNFYICGTRFRSAGVAHQMEKFGGCIATITEALPDERIVGGYVYNLAVTDVDYGWQWDISMFDGFNAWRDKKEAPRKKSEERGEDYYGDSQEIIDDVTGIKTDFFAYDYKGRKRAFPDIDGFITKIEVTIISGDETGLIFFVKDGKANRMAFDASVGTRFISYDDGTYTVEGKDNIKKWLSWSYDKDKAKNVNYAIQHMTDFLGGDK